MDDEFEGALNDADVSPTDSAGETDILETSQDGIELADDAQDDSAAQSLNNGAPDVEEGTERGPVPYERFQQVNERAQRAAELEQQLAEVTEAANLGLAVPQYQQLKQQAAQYGFPDTNSYLAAVQQQQAIAAELENIQAQNELVQSRPDLDPEFKQQFASLVRQQEVTSYQQAQLAQQAIVLQSHIAAQEHAAKAAVIKDAEETFGRLDPELVAMLNVATSEQARKLVAGMKATLGPVKQKTVADYNAQKAKERQAAAAAPEVRSGRPVTTPNGGGDDFRKASIWGMLKGQTRSA